MKPKMSMDELERAEKSLSEAFYRGNAELLRNHLSLGLSEIQARKEELFKVEAELRRVRGLMNRRRKK